MSSLRRNTLIFKIICSHENIPVQIIYQFLHCNGDIKQLINQQMYCVGALIGYILILLYVVIIAYTLATNDKQD